ncbi:unnamed protein product [Schistosoma margrebowiei]|uniref:Uncharacterized protein n=1 Tax=Schistosoma margrebowiei TaxID=48269 RepID=A0A183M188_9TREM|nr:unnamed protein product [Schistosoma margrebowiei]
MKFDFFFKLSNNSPSDMVAISTRIRPRNPKPRTDRYVSIIFCGRNTSTVSTGITGNRPVPRETTTAIGVIGLF